MTTPFTAFANATLTIPVPTGPESVDAYGNVQATTETLTVTAMLNPSDRQVTSNPFGGANTEEQYVEGRCVEPTKLPFAIQPETICDATVNGDPYKFRLLPSLNSAYGQDEILGQPLRGYLQQATVWGGAA